VRLILCISLLMVLFGCSVFSSMKASGPKIIDEKEDTTLLPDGTQTIKKRKRIVDAGAYKGPPTEETNFGSAEVGGDGAKAGSTVHAGFKVLAGLKVVYVLAALAIIGGIAFAVVANIKLGAAVAGGGLLLLVITPALEANPWLGMIPLAALLFGGGYLLYTLYRGNAATKVTQAVVPVIENAASMLYAETVKLGRRIQAMTPDDFNSWANDPAQVWARELISKLKERVTVTAQGNHVTVKKEVDRVKKTLHI